MPAPPCQPGCQCRKHDRTELHNQLIARGVSRTYHAKKAKGIPHMTPQTETR